MPPAVEIFCVCLDVEKHESGHGYNLIQVINRATFPQFPAITEKLLVAGVLRFDLADEGEHQISLSATSLDNHSGPTMGQILNVKAKADDQYAWTPFFFVLEMFALRGPGEVSFDLAIDGTQLAKTVICVAQASPSTRVST
jgi:hypothetical protein